MPDNQESISLNVDLLQRHMPYRLGRLFALLERLQLLAYPKAAPNVYDRFWASSSANPATGFRVPLQMVPVYLGRIPPQQRKVFRRIFEDLSTELPISHLPRALSHVEQGVFSLGYCYQRTSLITGQFGGKRG